MIGVDSIKDISNTYFERKNIKTYVGLVVGGLLLFATHVFIGRFFGVETYGSFQVIQAISNIIIIFMLGGFHVVMMQGDHGMDRRRLFFSTLSIVSILSVTVGLILYVARDAFSLINVDDRIVLYSILFSFFFGFHQLTKSFFQCAGRYYAMMVFEVALYFFVMISIVVAFFILKVNIVHVVISFILGFGIYSLGSIIYFRLSPKFISKGELKKIFRISYKVFIVSLLGVFVVSVDRMILNYYYSVIEVGLYGAYLFSTTIAILFLARLIISVFVPSVAQMKQKNQHEAYKNILSLEKKLFIPIIIFNFFSGYLLLSLFGSEYLLSIKYLFLASCSGGILFFVTIRQWFLIGLGEKGVSAMTKVVLSICFLSILIFWMLIKIYGLNGAFIAVLLVNILFYSVNYYVLKSLIYSA